jgi:hypothetical protein
MRFSVIGTPGSGRDWPAVRAAQPVHQHDRRAVADDGNGDLLTVIGDEVLELVMADRPAEHSEIAHRAKQVRNTGQSRRLGLWWAKGLHAPGDRTKS